MAGNKYLSNLGGTTTEVAASQTSAGAGDAGKIPALDATGKLDTSMMPVGVAADVKVMTTSENLAAGDFVNVYNVAGVATARRADGSTTGKIANAFVLAATTSGTNATLYFVGPNTQVSGATPGVVFLSATTPGGFSSTAPSAAGQTVQRLGVATSATEINFTPAAPLTLA